MRFVVVVFPSVPVTPMTQSRRPGQPKNAAEIQLNASRASRNRTYAAGACLNSISPATAAAPLEIASAMKSWPSVERPRSATNRKPGSTRRLSIDMPVIATSGTADATKPPGTCARISLKEDRCSSLSTMTAVAQTILSPNKIAGKQYWRGKSGVRENLDVQAAGRRPDPRACAELWVHLPPAQPGDTAKVHDRSPARPIAQNGHHYGLGLGPGSTHEHVCALPASNYVHLDITVHGIQRVGDPDMGKALDQPPK